MIYLSMTQRKQQKAEEEAAAARAIVEAREAEEAAIAAAAAAEAARKAEIAEVPCLFPISPHLTPSRGRLKVANLDIPRVVEALRFSTNVTQSKQFAFSSAMRVCPRAVLPSSLTTCESHVQIERRSTPEARAAALAAKKAAEAEAEDRRLAAAKVCCLTHPSARLILCCSHCRSSHSACSQQVDSHACLSVVRLLIILALTRRNDFRCLCLLASATVDTCHQQYSSRISRPISIESSTSLVSYKPVWQSNVRSSSRNNEHGACFLPMQAKLDELNARIAAKEAEAAARAEAAAEAAAAAAEAKAIADAEAAAMAAADKEAAAARETVEAAAAAAAEAEAAAAAAALRPPSPPPPPPPVVEAPVVPQQTEPQPPPVNAWSKPLSSLSASQSRAIPVPQPAEQSQVDANDATAPAAPSAQPSAADVKFVLHCSILSI